MNKNTFIRTIGWVMVVMVIVLTLIKLPTTQRAIVGGDKILHLSCYFILTFWFLHAYPKKLSNVLLGFIAMGSVLEVLQSLTIYRYFEWLDLCMNTTGALIAYWLFVHRRFQIRDFLCGQAEIDSKQIR